MTNPSPGEVIHDLMIDFWGAHVPNEAQALAKMIYEKLTQKYDVVRKGSTKAPQEPYKVLQDPARTPMATAQDLADAKLPLTSTSDGLPQDWARRWGDREPDDFDAEKFVKDLLGTQGAEDLCTGFGGGGFISTPSMRDIDDLRARINKLEQRPTIVYLVEHLATGTVAGVFATFGAAKNAIATLDEPLNYDIWEREIKS